MSNVSAWGNTVSSRLAEGHHSVTLSPALIWALRSRTSLVAVRRLYGFGGHQRSTSSTARGSRDRSARRAFQSFFQRYGVPAMDLGASSTGGGGNYHCSCDDYYWMSHFGDPTWQYHVGMSRLVGITALRLANADVIPMRYAPYASEVTGYLNDFTQQQKDTFGSVKVDVSRDVAQAESWQQAASALESTAGTALAKGDTETFGRLNAKLMQAERDLLTSAGLPDRPWYQHQIYAPGIDTGYATQRLPALHDALFLDDDVATATAYEVHLHESLQAATRTLTP
jgi:Transferrin receptor-like dimerisation domain